MFSLPPIQLLFLLLSLLQLCHQVYTVGQQGLMRYCRTPYNWLEVSLSHMHKHTHRRKE